MPILPAQSTNPVSLLTPRRASGTRENPPGQSDTPQQGGADKVSISASAQSLQKIGFDRNDDGRITTDEIRLAHDEHVAAAQSILQQTMRDLGIPADTEISIETDPASPTGDILVTGDLTQQQQARLTEALNNDGEFRNQFNGAASTGLLLFAAENHGQYLAAYKQNPAYAQAKYSQMLDNYTFSLGIG